MKIKRKNLVPLIEAVKQVIRVSPEGGWQLIKDWDTEHNLTAIEDLYAAYSNFTSGEGHR